MTYEQESMWLDDHLDAGPSRYVAPWACRFTGRLDVTAAEWALSQIVRRHQALRSRLALEGDEPAQIVMESNDVRLAQGSCPPATLPDELARIVSQPLSPSTMRPWLLRLGREESVVVVQFHHAVVDSWALGIFEREFSELYSDRVLGRPSQLSGVPPQLGDYAVAQRSAGLDPLHLGYWKAHMRGFASPCTIVPDRLRSRSTAHTGGQLRFSLSADLGRLVTSASQEQRATPFMVFAAVMAVVLSLQSGKLDVTFGTPVSRRGSAALNQIMGCLSDLLPLRLEMSKDVTLAALIQAARREVIGALRHKDIPYSALLKQVDLDLGSGGVPLCPTALVVDDATDSGITLPGIKASRISIPPARSKFDLCLMLEKQDDDGYTGFCDYAAELYDPGTIARVVNQFIDVLSEGLNAPDRPLYTLIPAKKENHG